MTSFVPNPDEFKSQLSGKVAVITGGASGIGAATVKAFHAAGASVVFGDITEDVGQKTAEELNKSAGDERATFVQYNAASYDDNLKLFKTALQKYGSVDHVAPIAGIGKDPGWFYNGGSGDPITSLEEVEKPGNNMLLDVNLMGVLYFVRIAIPYMLQGGGISAGHQKSITLLSSVGGFSPLVGIPLYTVAKHGLMGLMRCFNGHMALRSEIRTNTINPSFVSTGMTDEHKDKWAGRGLPMSTPEFIAEVILSCAARSDCAGKALFCSAMKSWDVEEGLNTTEEHWLGEAHKHVRVFKKSREQAKQNERAAAEGKSNGES